MESIYTRDTITKPVRISRIIFVKTIFSIGYLEELGLATIMSAVEIGDKYIKINRKHIYSISC